MATNYTATAADQRAVDRMSAPSTTARLIGRLIVRPMTSVLVVLTGNGAI